MSKNVVDIKTFCVTWQKNGGDSEKVANIFQQSRTNVVCRYKKYKEAGINLCDIKPVENKRPTISSMAPELNKILEEVTNGN